MGTKQNSIGLAVASGLLNVACLSSVCDQKCSLNGDCPGTNVCDSSIGYCHPKGRPEACSYGELRSSEPEETDPESTEISEDAGVQRQGSSPEVAALTLLPLFEEEVSLCTERALALDFRLSGGTPPYVWSLEQAPAGLELDSDESEFAELKGAASEPGPVRLRALDSNGDSARLEFLVRATPVVLSEELPPLCHHERFSQSLSAEGGVAAEYRWTATLASSSQSMDSLGLTIDNGVVSGRFERPAGAEPLGLQVVVKDSHCESAAKTLSLQILPPRTTQCPELVVAGSELPNPRELPASCRNVAYREELRLERSRGASAGSAAETVQVAATELPEGLSFNAETGVLEGLPTTSGTAVVELTTPERVIEETFRLEPRDRCWLGYIDSNAEGSRLQLEDARRLSFRPADVDVPSARRSYPPEGVIGSVVDFEFSPNGKSLAYRLQPEDGAAQLVVVDLETGEEQVVRAGVTRYSWSENSGRLALVAESDDGLLASIVQRGEGDWLAAARPVPIFPDAPPAQVHSKPLWFSADSWAILADYGGTPLIAPGWLTLSDDNATFFVEQQPSPADVRLRRSRNGFVMYDAFATFFSPGRDAVPHGTSVIVSPEGNYVARSEDGLLQVFPVHISARLGDSTLAAATQGCTQFLSWSPDEGRLACWSNASEQIVVYELELKEGQLSLDTLGTIQGSYRLRPDFSPPFHRVFSQSGSRLAFTTPEGAYLANLSEFEVLGNVEYLTAELIPGTSTALSTDRMELQFSPNERLLAIGQSRARRSVTVLARGRTQLLNSEASASQSCREEDSRDWCGVEPSRPRAQWALGSDLLVESTADDQLVVHDMSHVEQFSFDEHVLNPTCLENCIAPMQFQFQP